MMSAGAVSYSYYLSHFAVLVVATYVNISFLLKKYFLKEKYVQYTISVIVLWLLALVAIYLSVVISGYPAPDQEYYQKKIIASMFGLSTEFFFLSMFKIAKELYKRSKRSKELEIEKMQAELSMLKSQLDAHFLFNTLNNLYLLVLNKSDKAPDAILMLSELLSYNIYESRQAKVPVAKECEFIRNYINLQKLRLQHDQEVHFAIHGTLKGAIEPLLMFNFIENVFKHAANRVSVNGHNYYAFIEIKLDGTTLELVTINGYSKENAEKKNEESRGIGIDSTIRRLNAAYGKDYELEINKEEEPGAGGTGRYYVHLKIKELQ